MTNDLNNCKIINKIWIERGIILAIIYYINKLYDYLKDKIIIIEQKNYQKILKHLFPKLQLSQFKKKYKNNFYFNIRQIILKKDIIIDYLHNYDKYIPAKKFKYIPWYDYNDPLIIYKYSPNDKVLKNYYHIPKCIRSKYNDNLSWDQYKENKIILDLHNKFNYKIDYILDIIDKNLTSNYTDITIKNKNKIKYIPIPISHNTYNENKPDNTLLEILKNRTNTYTNLNSNILDVLSTEIKDDNISKNIDKALILPNF